MADAERNILLFMNNAPFHPENIVVLYSNMKVVFLPKNTTSRLQALDAGIISKETFVISQIDDN